MSPRDPSGVQPGDLVRTCVAFPGGRMYAVAIPKGTVGLCTYRGPNVMGLEVIHVAYPGRTVTHSVRYNTLDGKTLLPRSWELAS